MSWNDEASKRDRVDKEQFISPCWAKNNEMSLLNNMQFLQHVCVVQWRSVLQRAGAEWSPCSRNEHFQVFATVLAPQGEHRDFVYLTLSFARVQSWQTSRWPLLLLLIQFLFKWWTGRRRYRAEAEKASLLSLLTVEQVKDAFSDRDNVFAHVFLTVSKISREPLYGGVHYLMHIYNWLSLESVQIKMATTADQR